MQRIVALLIGITLTSGADAEPLTLNLICVGSGQQERQDLKTARVTSDSGEAATAQIHSSHAEMFDDEVRVEIAGQGGRLRVPQTMLPAIRGGDKGWMPLRQIAATPDEITGVATINILNKAKLRIDRITGILSMTVLGGSFRGKCTPYDPATVQRAF